MLFTDVQKQLRLKSNKAEVMYSEHQMLMMTDDNPAFLALKNEAMKIVDETIHDKLTPRQVEVINMRFGLGGHHVHSLEEVGNIYNVTACRIRQIEAKALRKLRYKRNRTPLIEAFDSMRDAPHM